MQENSIKRNSQHNKEKDKKKKIKKNKEERSSYQYIEAKRLKV